MVRAHRPAAHVYSDLHTSRHLVGQAVIGEAGYHADAPLRDALRNRGEELADLDFTIQHRVEPARNACDKALLASARARVVAVMPEARSSLKRARGAPSMSVSGRLERNGFRLE